MSEVVPFPARHPPRSSSEAALWAAYLDACDQLHREYPNVNVSTCRRVADAYERYCWVLYGKGGRR